jgi:hypothetical protein
MSIRCYEIDNENANTLKEYILNPNLNNVIEFNTDYRLTSGKNNEVIHDLILRLLNRLNLKIDGTI